MEVLETQIIIQTLGVALKVSCSKN